MKVLLIGMNNPYSLEAHFALYPLPATSAGGRLFRMMRDAVPDLRQSEYCKIFDRMNLVVGDWDRTKAVSKAAMMVKDGCRKRRVVLLGEEVKRAFETTKAVNVPPEQFVWSPSYVQGERWATLPHPSGRAMTWNDPVVKVKAAEFFRGLVGVARDEALEAENMA